MPQEGMNAWDKDNEKWAKVKTDDQGRLYTVAVIDELDDIGDVNVPAPADNEALIWDAVAGEWVAEAPVPAAHKDSHDPIDGSDKLDSAIPVKVAAANAIGSSHSFSRADHAHEREHAKYTNAEAVTAMGALADDNPLNHNRAEEWGAAEHTAIGDAAPHHAKYTNGEAVTAMGAKANDNPLHHDRFELSANMRLLTITFIIDGGSSAITTGQKGHLEIPFSCLITGVTMLADQSGSIVVDIWKTGYAGFPPDNGDSITSATPPTITTAQKSQDITLTGWTTGISASDILAFNVDSCTTIERVTISLKMLKSL